MTITTGPNAGMIGQRLSEFDHKADAAEMKSASQSKHGVIAIPGKSIPFLTPRQYALFRGVSTKTLERERAAGKGPAFKRLRNGRIRYYIADIDAWIDRQIMDESNQQGE